MIAIHPARERTRATSRRPIKVLMIDDQPETLEEVREHLESRGQFDLTIVDSPVAGLELAAQLEPDIIFVDMVMPVLDGEDVLDRLSKNPALKDVPVIILSWLLSGDETGTHGFIRSGNNLMMPKPPNPRKIVDCIDRVLAGDIDRIF